MLLCRGDAEIKGTTGFVRYGRWDSNKRMRLGRTEVYQSVVVVR